MPLDNVQLILKNKHTTNRRVLAHIILHCDKAFCHIVDNHSLIIVLRVRPAEKSLAPHQKRVMETGSKQRGYASACMRAAVTTLLISMALVMGPTPPGTGVMAPATLKTSS